MAKPILIPFTFSASPMQKLAIVNFERKPDSVYKGLELQYFAGGAYGTGHRVIAWRCDGYVDVYDDLSLNSQAGEDFDVAGKGLAEHLKVNIDNARLEKKDGCYEISFAFTDKLNRSIAVKIQELSGKETKGINLLAPVGASTENPSSLPLFFLYQFDFLRKRSEVTVTIDGTSIRLDNFPVPLPKDLQWRYYTRYSLDCQMVEFAKAGTKVLQKHMLPPSETIVHNGAEYRFSDNSLKQISLLESRHPLHMDFELGFPDILSLTHNSQHTDTFRIFADESMGHISGGYTVSKTGDKVKIDLTPTGGWTPVPNSVLTKIMFGNNSVFRTWPKTYRYLQDLDLASLSSHSHWERIKG